MDFRTGKTYDDMPLVTIGVLSYNYSRYLSAALNSLLSQTYPYIELIIVDDCSTENTVEIIEEWIQRNQLQCIFIQNKTNEGITKVSNKLVRLSKGKYLNLFATDDIMLPEKIERQVEILEKSDYEYAMCYSNAETMDEENKSTGLYMKECGVTLPEGNVLASFVYNKMKFSTPTALIRTDAYKVCGLYDERVLIEDYNFWLRFFACFKAKLCSYPCLMYRVKKQSGIFDKWNNNNKERYYSDRILSNHAALKYIDDIKLKTYLQSKISQYLKALSANRSAKTLTLIRFLLKNKYYKIPGKVIFREGLNKISKGKYQPKTGGMQVK